MFSQCESAKGFFFFNCTKCLKTVVIKLETVLVTSLLMLQDSLFGAYGFRGLESVMMKQGHEDLAS